MSVEIIETSTSRSFDVGYADGTGERLYVVRCLGEADPITAIVTAVAADAPFYWNNMSRQKFQVKNAGGDIYTVTVPYAYGPSGGDGAGTGGTQANAPDPTQPPGLPGTGPGGSNPSTSPSGPANEDEPIGPNLTISLGGKPPKLYQSKGTVYARGPKGSGTDDPTGEVAPDYRGAINVDKDGKVEGAELDDPAMVYSLTVKYDSISRKFLKLLAAAMWNTNASNWHSFDARTLYLMSAEVKTDNQGRAELTFKIGHNPTRVIKAGEIWDDNPADPAAPRLPAESVSKDGFDYLWFKYETVKSTSPLALVERAKYMYVERMLPEVEYSNFGAGA